MPAAGTRIAELVRRSPLRRLRRPGRILYPRAPERQYKAQVTGIVKELEGEVSRVLLPLLPRLAAQGPWRGAGRRDAWYDELEGAVSGLYEWFGRRYTQAEVKRLAAITGKSVEYWNRQELTKSITRAIEFPFFFHDAGLGEALEAWTYDNARLITKVGEDMIGAVQGTVSRGVTEGLGWEDIARQIQDLGLPGTPFRTAEQRAEGVARDQVGKLFGDLSERRQTELGIEEYDWETAHDSAVRPEHAARQGKRFRWDSPPEDGNPGQPIMCRCWAAPVIEL